MVIAEPSFQGNFRISFGFAISASAAVALPEFPYNPFSIRVILEHPRCQYRVPVICRNQCYRIGCCGFGIPHGIIDISIGTNLSVELLFHIVGSRFFQEEQAPFRQITDIVEKAVEVNVVRCQIIINPPHPLVDVMKCIDLILKQFLCLYGVIEGVVQFV